MRSSSIITLLAAIAGIVSAAPAAIKARDASLDVYITEATQDSHAINVELGVVKVSIGDNGFAPSFATQLSISPWGADIDVTTVTCNAFTNTDGTGYLGSFTSSSPLSFNGVPTAVGSVTCN